MKDCEVWIILRRIQCPCPWKSAPEFRYFTVSRYMYTDNIAAVVWMVVSCAGAIHTHVVWLCEPKDIMDRNFYRVVFRGMVFTHSETVYMCFYKLEKCMLAGIWGGGTCILFKCDCGWAFLGCFVSNSWGIYCCETLRERWRS